MMRRLDSMRGWQSPMARTPSPRAPAVREPPEMEKLSYSQGEAPAQGSSQAPTEFWLPLLVPSAATRLARTTVPTPSPERRIPAACPCERELHSELRATTAPGESSNRTA